MPPYAMMCAELRIRADGVQRTAVAGTLPMLLERGCVVVRVRVVLHAATVLGTRYSKTHSADESLHGSVEDHQVFLAWPSAI